MSDLASEIFGSTSFTLDASFGGVPFAMIDSRDGPGRRAIRFLFPGLDTPAFQDLGQLDGEIPVTGIMVGDDYVAQANALRSAFRVAGPQTLIHPWLGNIQVVPVEPPQISFSQDELGVARFTAKFWLFDASTAQAAPDTQAGLLGQLDALRQAAYGLLDQVAGVASQVLGVVSYARGFCNSVGGFFSLAIADATGVTSELLGPAAAPALAALAAQGGLPLGATLPAFLGPLLAGPSAALLAAAQPPIPAAVAPGGPTTPAPAADPRLTTDVLLAAVTSIGARASDPAPGPALALLTQALVLADALTVASDIVFTSQQDAETWRTTQLAAIDAVASAAMLQGVTYPTLAGTVWRAAIGTRSALCADMTAQIGRLPAVISLTLAAPAPVWLIAQYLAGDTPGAVFNTYQDLVARNGIENPGLPQRGPIEALAPA